MSQIHMKIMLAATLSLFCLRAIIPDCIAAEEPAIRMNGGNHLLILTKEQKDAIRTYNSAFQIRSRADYLPSLVNGYPFSTRQLPFAVIGDFNGDGKLDVVLQGHDKTNDLIIAVLSASGGPIVMEVMKSQLVDPQKEFYTMGSHTEYGLWTYLTFVPRGDVESPFARRPLKLTADAFALNYFEKASVLYYLNGQSFQKYILSD
jgi:hypothetical protein